MPDEFEATSYNANGFSDCSSKVKDIKKQSHKTKNARSQNEVNFKANLVMKWKITDTIIEYEFSKFRFENMTLSVMTFNRLSLVECFSWISDFM